MNNRISRNNRFSGLILLLLLLSILRFLDNYYNDNGSQEEPDEMNVFVEIEGDIRYPGVYSFKQNTDLKRLISMGGGLNSESINPDAINNISLESGKKVSISINNGEPDVSIQEMTAFHKLTLEIPISINHESEEGLTSLPGIGPRLASAIVSERKKRGGFKKMKELMNVRGMGEKKYNKIMSYITE
jgi:competence protein ComEA